MLLCGYERYGEEFDGHTGMGGVEVWIPVESLFCLIAVGLRGFAKSTSNFNF